MISDHAFAKNCLKPNCFEVKIMRKRQKVLFLERRRALLKFLYLFEGLVNMKMVHNCYSTFKQGSRHGSGRSRCLKLNQTESRDLS